MKIIYLLSGPGKKDGFSKEIIDYMKKDFKNKRKITFIPSSSNDYLKNDLYVHGNGDNIVGIINHLKEVADLDEINILDKRINIDTGKQILLNSEIIYLLGGNPFTQLEYIKLSGYDKVLEKFNGLILGTSAGAMNLAHSAYYSKDEDFDKSIFYNALGLIDITIDPHFDINNKEQVDEIIKNSIHREIIGLPNESSIRISDNKIDFIGKYYKVIDKKLEEIN